MVKEELIINKGLADFHTFEPMKKRILNIIIALIVLSLLGIISVQYFWIRNAINIKEAQFDRTVNEALTSAVNKLETREDIVYMRNNMIGDSIHTLVQAFSTDSILSLNDKLDSLLSQENFSYAPPPPPPPSSPFPSGSFSFGNNQGFIFNYQWQGDFEGNDSLIMRDQPLTLVIPDDFNESFPDIREAYDLQKIDSLLRQYQSENLIIPPRRDFHYRRESHQDMKHAPGRKPEPKARQGRQTTIHANINIRATHNHDFDPNQVARNDMRKISKKARKIKDVIHKMAIELESKPLPIAKRVDKNNLENVLKKSFAEKNIDLAFEFAILSPSNKTNPLPIKTKDFKKEYLSTPHRVSLFPNDLFQKPDRLLVFFPGQKNVLLRSLSWLMLMSILFTLIIAITSVLSIFIMLRQKKISDIKTDFINNMTHEFKTPLATISIAVDSINNPKVIELPDVIRSYTKVIKEENNRMNSRVEQVLQMALLDSSEFTLDLQPIDFHALIEKVSNYFRLQVESREGHLELSLNAENSMVYADETHLSNVLINLLDNANKYSPQNPEIRVSTRNSGTSILVTVEDQGIGMNPETRNKIFEKFFRVTSGNIHNVKGFGLGLSYSKAIILSHKGEILVNSEPGKGSTFVISLPLIPDNV